MLGDNLFLGEGLFCFFSMKIKNFQGTENLCFYRVSKKSKVLYINISTANNMTIENNLKLLKALSEETRYKIIEVLLQGEKCACEIPKFISRTQSNTSMHLTKLSDLGILKSRRDGKRIFYSIKDLRVCDVFKALGYPKGKLLKSYCCMDKNKK